MMPDYHAVFEALKALIEGDVTDALEDRERVARDTSLFYVRPEIVVYPKSKEDLKKVLKYTYEERKKGMPVSIAMRAAGTCMTGGPLSQSIVIDTTRYMHRILSADEREATAEPGVFYRDFEKETLKHGWIMPSYPASRELAAIGGIVSNNSGGEKTLTYGKTENYVQALDVVFANGESDTLIPLREEKLMAKIEERTESGRIHKAMYELITEHYDAIKAARPSVSKNSAGYYLWNVYDKETGIFDLTKLIVGSQGTLAAVASATLSGVKPEPHRRMLVMFLPTTGHLGEIVPKMLEYKPETLESYDDHTFNVAIKFFKDIALRMGGNMITLGFKFLPEFWMAVTGGVPKIILMAEFAGATEEEAAEKADACYRGMKQFDCPIRKLRSEEEAKKYWTFRREAFNLLRSHMHGTRTAPTIDDLIVHPSDLPDFLPKLDAIFKRYPDLIYTMQGHMGNANFHVIPLVDIHKMGIAETLHALMEEVYALVFSYGGSMTAEHNDGLLRTPYLPRMYPPNIISLFEITKNIFDPLNVLNPGKKVYGDMAYTWNHVDKK